jgi:hypothetical protein
VSATSPGVSIPHGTLGNSPAYDGCGAKMAGPEVAGYCERSLPDLRGSEIWDAAAQLVQLNLVAVLLDRGHDVERQGQSPTAIFE